MPYKLSFATLAMKELLSIFIVPQILFPVNVYMTIKPDQ